jgi:hypothetical protein
MSVWYSSNENRQVCCGGVLKASAAVIRSAAPRMRPTKDRGLKARSILAWGNAPGYRPTAPCGLKARAKTIPRHQLPPRASLVPNKPLIELHTILLEHRPHLRLKIPPLMMRRLPIDIPHQRIPITQPNRKRRIPALPPELRELRPLGLDPLRRRNLQSLHQLRQRFGTRNEHGNMNMIRNTPNTHANILRPIQHRSQISMHLGTNPIFQPRPSLLRTEHKMHEHIREGLRHASEYSAGLQPAYSAPTPTWGVAPGYRSSALQAAPSLHSTERQ